MLIIQHNFLCPPAVKAEGGHRFLNKVHKNSNYKRIGCVMNHDTAYSFIVCSAMTVDCVATCIIMVYGGYSDSAYFSSQSTTPRASLLLCDSTPIVIVAPAGTPGMMK